MKFADLTLDQKQEICNRYTTGEIMSEIAPDFQVSVRTIGDWLKRLGIVTRRKPPTREDIDVMKNHYLTGESLYSLARRFPYSRKAIGSYLSSEIQLRDKITTLRKYRIDETYFDNIDSERKAYWLGFIYADGYCMNDFVVQLAVLDVNHLYALRQDLNSTHPIKKTPDNQVRLYISNRHLSQALERFPITPKSEITFPLIPSTLHRHFIRGYMDGDGGFYSYKRIRAIFCITTANPVFLHQVELILMANCGLGPTLRPTSHNSYEIRWSAQNDVSRVYDYLYRSANIWMPRKRKQVEWLFD